jgi:hypothetical protein
MLKSIKKMENEKAKAACSVNRDISSEAPGAEQDCSDVVNISVFLMAPEITIMPTKRKKSGAILLGCILRPSIAPILTGTTIRSIFPVWGRHITVQPRIGSMELVSSWKILS